MLQIALVELCLHFIEHHRQEGGAHFSDQFDQGLTSLLTMAQLSALEAVVHDQVDDAVQALREVPRGQFSNDLGITNYNEPTDHFFVFGVDCVRLKAWKDLAEEPQLDFLNLLFGQRLLLRLRDELDNLVFISLRFRFGRLLNVFELGLNNFCEICAPSLVGFGIFLLLGLSLQESLDGIGDSWEVKSIKNSADGLDYKALLLQLGVSMRTDRVGLVSGLVQLEGQLFEEGEVV
mmetsp:Transcript_20805/g.32090  ORF Transcript_20805/g.32090 Transcript_20805/m.32090 type:complete len:234 (-) Transcript_20805:3041-3742(-)